MPLPRLVVLENTIRAAGIPISGVQNSGPPYPAGVTIDYLPSATAEQIAQAEQIKELFDYRARRNLTRQQLAAGLAALTQAQQTTVLRHLLAILIRQGSSAADVEAALAETGVPFAVDEVVP